MNDKQFKYLIFLKRTYFWMARISQNYTSVEQYRIQAEEILQQIKSEIDRRNDEMYSDIIIQEIEDEVSYRINLFKGEKSIKHVA